MRLWTLLRTAGLALALTAHAIAIEGVISDPDGYTHVRARPSRESAIVATVKQREVFEFEGELGANWCAVTLASGKKGYMHSSRIRLHATMADLADTTPGDEVNEWSRRHGLDPYYPQARAAAKGDPAAMRKLFVEFGDGAAAETHQHILGVVLHLVGDEKFAKFLGSQPERYRADVRDFLVERDTLYPFKGETYLKSHFPRSAAKLFP